MLLWAPGRICFSEQLEPMTGLRRTAGHVAKLTIISCEGAREVVSARFDGQKSEMSEAILDDHLASCERCRDFQSHLATLSRRARLQASRPVPESLVTVVAPLLPTSTGAPRTYRVDRSLQ
jgi:hypothetical protein